MHRLLIITQKVDESDQLLGFFIAWIQRFAQQFAHVHVLCLQKGSYKLPNNVSVESMGKDRGYSKARQLFEFYRFIIAQRREYDVVCVHMNPIWAALGGLVWRIMHKRVYLWYTHKAVTMRLRIAHAMVHRVFSASPESFRLPSTKVMFTGHGIDTDVFSPGDEQLRSKDSLLTVGRIAPVKNLEVLVDAMSLLAQQGSLLRVVVVGEAALDVDRAYEDLIRKRINNAGIVGRFVFAGKHKNDEVRTFYRECALFVHMSRTGSLDKTLLEAMACGARVVSSNDAARAFLPPELIFDGANQGDLARGINRALSELPAPSLRAYVVEHHNLDTLIQKLSKEMISVCR
ncbi:MAG: glycosyltransferase family 4 protein [Patescibacteria group bacterium]